MLRRTGLMVLALAALLLVTQRTAHAGTFGFGIGVYPAYPYPAYPYAYANPYACNPYINAYCYGYGYTPYVYPGFGYYGGYYGYPYRSYRGYYRGYGYR